MAPTTRQSIRSRRPPIEIPGTEGGRSEAAEEADGAGLFPGFGQPGDQPRQPGDRVGVGNVAFNVIRLEPLAREAERRHGDGLRAVARGRSDLELVGQLPIAAEAGEGQVVAADHVATGSERRSQAPIAICATCRLFPIWV